MLQIYLKQYQQKANVRLSYFNDILTISTTGKANRYAHNVQKLTKAELGGSENRSGLLIEKSKIVLENADLLWKPKTPYKSQLKRMAKADF